MDNLNEDILVAFQTIDKEIETLNKLRDNLPVQLTEVLNLIQNIKGRVIITGMGKSGHIGKKIAASLASTGTPSFFVHPSEASHGDLGMITNDDVVLAISNSGEAKELSDIVAYCGRFGITLIAITKNPESTLGKASDFILTLPSNGEACPLGLAPTNSTTATLVLGDVLTTILMKRRGFTADDFANRHPGGKLGSKLQKVSDLMHVGDDMPLVDEDVLMDTALMVMSKKMLGCVGVVNDLGQLIGIITDGDLRRCMHSQLLTQNVKETMTKNPKTIDKDVVATAVANKMKEFQISNLFVLDEQKRPIGIIHIQDLLRAGVI